MEKNTVTKVLKRQPPLRQYIIQVFVPEYNNDKQIKKKQTEWKKKGVLLSCLVTEGFFPTNAIK